MVNAQNANPFLNNIFLAINKVMGTAASVGCLNAYEPTFVANS
jgi:hypothetical protein